MSADDPLAATRAGLLAAAGLPARWAGADVHVVLDLAFGDGLAFVATRRAWRDDPRRPARLHYAALLERPLAADALAARLRAHRVPDDEAGSLRAEWPPGTPGVHRVVLDGGRVVLHLAIGPARRMLPRWLPRADTVLMPTEARGAPRCDAGIARTAAATLGRDGRLATGPVAALDAATGDPHGSDALDPASGDPRRTDALDALRSAGLAVVGTGMPGTAWATRVHGDAPSVTRPSSREALVIGAGLAGRAVAVALARRGWRVLRAGGGPRPGSLQPVLAQHPSLTPDDAPLSRLTRAALLAWRGAAWRGDAPPPCGRLQLMPEARARAIARGWPADWVRAVDAREAGERAGVALREGGLWLPLAGALDPRALAAAWSDPRIVALDGAAGTTLVREADAWHLEDAQGRRLARAPVAVIATGAATIAIRTSSRAATFDARTPLGDAGVHVRTDRVTLATLPAAAMPRCIVGGDGHAVPVDATTLLLGPAPSVEARAGGDVEPAPPRTDEAPPDTDAGSPPHGDEDASRRAWARHALRLADPPEPLALRPGPWGARLSTRDHLPLVGRRPDADGSAPDLWLATAFGGRGLLWSVLAAEAIAAALAAEPAPLERALADAIDPARFVRRDAGRR